MDRANLPPSGGAAPSQFSGAAAARVVRLGREHIAHDRFVETLSLQLDDAGVAHAHRAWLFEDLRWVASARLRTYEEAAEWALREIDTRHGTTYACTGGSTPADLRRGSGVASSLPLALLVGALLLSGSTHATQFGKARHRLEAAGGRRGRVDAGTLHAARDAVPLYGPTRAGKAARAFAAVSETCSWSGAPRSRRVTREDLSLSAVDVVMLDIGGEGQNMDADLRSGNLHALNVNAQRNVSPGPMSIEIDPGEPLRSSQGARIPNLIPIEHWPADDVPSASGFVPLADAFANLVIMEGTPVFDYHVEELDRLTTKSGWIVLNVDASFASRIEALAARRNRGEFWRLSERDPLYSDRFVIPPAGVPPADAQTYRALFEQATSHDLYEVLQAIELHRRGHVPEASRDAVRLLADERGEVDFSVL